MQAQRIGPPLHSQVIPTRIYFRLELLLVSCSRLQLFPQNCYFEFEICASLLELLGLFIRQGQQLLLPLQLLFKRIVFDNICFKLILLMNCFLHLCNCKNGIKRLDSKELENKELDNFIAGEIKNKNYLARDKPSVSTYSAPCSNLCRLSCKVKRLSGTAAANIASRWVFRSSLGIFATPSRNHVSVLSLAFSFEGGSGSEISPDMLFIVPNYARSFRDSHRKRKNDRTINTVFCPVDRRPAAVSPGPRLRAAPSQGAPGIVLRLFFDSIRVIVVRV